jgi:endonuclease/exonuclease/phosphatase (EEP) superfamily protein YafD
MATVVACAGILLRLGIRDRWPVCSTIFYATPWLVLAGCCLVAAAWGTATRLTRVFWTATASFCVMLWFVKDVRLQTPEPPAGAATARPLCRVLFWNLDRPEMHPKPVLLDLIHEHQPDIVACVETEGISEKEILRYREALPHYQLLRMPNDMVAFAKNPARHVAFHKLGGESYANEVEIQSATAPLRLFIADIHAAPTRNRKGPMQELLALTESIPNSIVAGDFNTPSDSCWFDPWRERFQHTWETAGSGVRQTWLHGLPILSLDHIWVEKRFLVTEFKKGQRYVGGSDHAWLFAVLAESAP